MYVCYTKINGCFANKFCVMCCIISFNGQIVADVFIGVLKVISTRVTLLRSGEWLSASRLEWSESTRASCRASKPRSAASKSRDSAAKDRNTASMNSLTSNTCVLAICSTISKLTSFPTAGVLEYFMCVTLHCCFHLRWYYAQQTNMTTVVSIPLSSSAATTMNGFQHIPTKNV